ncbi:CRISPR-associated protein Cas5 [Dethiosulfovibrio salsuginis]|uniref:CRISPR-associated protein, Cas5 family n=1 Tax=Dethiosulfovibrio salsuginis TaxID=561720 RepID=A0A1X7KRZ0_9BACT|nr:CRISPR-associated protein Cas5 [Dethiosulfovibrio salsuginis]SMG44343.1 CRISPR-associated protein, Cas5 family [Dethiosulfovibrio salsuginis]
MEALQVLRLGLRAQSASFRVPECHGFQPTLPLPPLTAMTGIVGAALGLDYLSAQDYVVRKGIRFGVIGTSDGRAKDLWKHRKIKGKETITSVLIRELMIGLKTEIFLVSKDSGTIEELRGVFNSPKYALSLGSSDDLALWDTPVAMRDVSLVPLRRLKNTLVRGSLAGRCRMSIDLKNVPLNRPIHPPMVSLLPTSYEGVKGERRVVAKEPFTFVDNELELEQDVMGIVWENKGVPLL